MKKQNGTYSTVACHIASCLPFSNCIANCCVCMSSAIERKRERQKKIMHNVWLSVESSSYTQRHAQMWEDEKIARRHRLKVRLPAMAYKWHYYSLYLAKTNACIAQKRDKIKKKSERVQMMLLPSAALLFSSICFFLWEMDDELYQ